VEPTIVILLSLLVGLVLLSVMMPLLGILSDFAM
jgi:type II secretory pathway, component pulF